MNILIAGNGLDIHHNCETGYVSFLKYAKEKKWEDNCFLNEFIASVEADGVPLEKYDPGNNPEKKKWIDCEEEIKTIVNAFIDAIAEGRFNDNDDIQAKVYKYFEKLLPSEGPSDFDAYYDKEGIFHKEKIVQKLRNELYGVVQYLRLYLIRAQKPSFNAELFTNIRFDCAVSLNYTEIVQKYVPEKSVYYIHGNLMDNNMVLGTYDIKDTDFVYFEKNFFSAYRRKPTILIQQRKKGLIVLIIISMDAHLARAIPI